MRSKKSLFKKTTLANLTKGLSIANTIAKGVVYKATDAEAKAGTNTDKFITPAQVRQNGGWEYVGELEWDNENTAKTINVTGGNYIFKCEYFVHSSSGGKFCLQLNGLSTSTYYFIKGDGTGANSTNGTYAIPLTDFSFGAAGEVIIAGKSGSNNNITVHNSGVSNTTDAQGGSVNIGTSTNLSSITFLRDVNDYNWTGKVKVYKKVV